MLKQMKQSAFTIIEILIVITIMGILLTLAVVNLSSTQVKARDSERHADVENISIALEGFYSNGMSSSPIRNSYPGVDNFQSDDFQDFLLDHVDHNSLYAPNIDYDKPSSLKPATNNKTNPSQVLPKPDTDTYVYQPLTSSGDLCVNYNSSLCTSFNLYYSLEKATDDCDYGNCIIRSKHS